MTPEIEGLCLKLETGLRWSDGQPLTGPIGTRANENLREAARTIRSLAAALEPFANPAILDIADYGLAVGEVATDGLVLTTEADYRRARHALTGGSK